MNLLDTDVQMFASIGVPVQLLAAAGVTRVTTPQARFECGIRYKSDELAGIAFPYRHVVDDQIVGWRVRRDHPERETDGSPIAKYLSSPDHRHLFFPPGAAVAIANTTVPVVVVEAEKSVLALTAAAQRHNRSLLALGTGGCWAWRGVIGKVSDPHGARVDEKGPLPDFDRVSWTGRDAVICFDANATTNPNVQAARRALATELRAWRHARQEARDWWRAMNQEMAWSLGTYRRHATAAQGVEIDDLCSETSFRYEQLRRMTTHQED